MAKPKIRIFDNSFMSWGKSASLLQDNRSVYPTHFEWTDNDSEAVPGINVYTDGNIRGVDRPNAIAWLLEPPHLRPENYVDVVELADKFDLVLTYDKSLLETLPNAKFYPVGGSSVAFHKWRIYPKTKDVCMILSDKQETDGHKLRHEIAARFGDRIDLYGPGVGKPFCNKFETLKDYRFAVVVENSMSSWYFSEKIIDCFSVGTIPIYWGCPEIWKYFDVHAFGTFSTLSDLWGHLELGTRLTSRTMEAGNLKLAENYRICEDNIWPILKQYNE